MKPLFRLLEHNVLKDNNAELTEIYYYEQFRANVKENFSVEFVISKECKTSTKYFCKFGWHTLSHDLLYKITSVLINALRTQKKSSKFAKGKTFLPNHETRPILRDTQMLENMQIVENG